MITYEINKSELRHIQNKLKGTESEATKVLSRAVNRTAITARKNITDEIRKTYTEKSGRAKKSMTIKRATYSHPTAIIKSTDKSQPSSYFSYSNGGRDGAKLQVRTDRPKSAVVSSKGGEERKAFVAKMSSGHVDVFQRQAGDYMDKSSSRHSKNKTKHNERIRAFRSPSSSKMMEKVYDGEASLGRGLKPEIEKTLRKNIEQQIRYTLSTR